MPSIATPPPINRRGTTITEELIAEIENLLKSSPAGTFIGDDVEYRTKSSGHKRAADYKRVLVERKLVKETAEITSRVWQEKQEEGNGIWRVAIAKRP